MKPLLTLALLSVAALAGRSQNTPALSMEAAAAAATRDALAFAKSLARDRVPAGFVVASESAEYTAQQSQWALVLKPRRATVCDAALKRSLSVGTFAAPAYEAFWRLALHINPGSLPSIPPGVVCGGNCSADLEPTYRRNVRLSLVGTTLEDGLSQIVHAAPGLVWLLRERWLDQQQEWTCTLEYFSDEEHLVTSYVVASGPRK